jgi:hypothetical protein
MLRRPRGLLDFVWSHGRPFDFVYLRCAAIPLRFDSPTAPFVPQLRDHLRYASVPLRSGSYERRCVVRRDRFADTFLRTWLLPQTPLRRTWYGRHGPPVPLHPGSHPRCLVAATPCRHPTAQGRSGERRHALSHPPHLPTPAVQFPRAAPPSFPVSIPLPFLSFPAMNAPRAFPEHSRNPP